MKLIFLLTFFTQISFAGIVIVSDFDDTIKHTNAKKPIEAIRNVLTKRRAFSGMPTLLNNMRNYAHKTYILTGSPSVIRGTVKSLLRKHRIQYDQLITSRTINRSSTPVYKKRELTRLLAKHPDDQFIFLGDDQGHDPEIYQEISDKHPGRVLDIYIHIIKNRPLPLEVLPYITAFDVAIHENDQNRMDIQDTRGVFLRVKKAKKFKYTIPGFAFCPTSSIVWREYPANELSEEFINYQKTIVNKCLAQYQEGLSLGQRPGPRLPLGVY